MGATRTTHPFAICWVDELLGVCGLTGWGESAVAAPGAYTFGEGWVGRATVEHITKAFNVCNIPFIDGRSIRKFFAARKYVIHIRYISGVP